ncbi:hypothetical protein [Mycolicibacterium mageritense]|uniref:Uncharacterized protein n=1 Tax=Mycolicibacterium mageritense TaxID=53462 RepID=A0AAI8TU98_MYCME|nr:hypothetical protein [Mycolicibacterium mageritense]MCC9180692.1 hypothetical protein [Mycolicibacterium mageritense]CDO23011.1 hypothetical protein BN978_03490 [Mycolicibacterium mageritense DSM 44476 = CIP 104973]BBX32448.1 hypothetical protein MMAGJ_17300 [Mycolicibacterium mageritense]BDY28883.1 hypothetical protein hbim_02819 [Mycolicibacterium mageritense]GJJ21210.1 hypothetical protein MTY414_48830 [Mycolicibacterium mageritense]
MESNQQPEAQSAALPLLDARAWALGFLVFSVIVAVIFSQYLIDFIASAH